MGVSLSLLYTHTYIIRISRGINIPEGNADKDTDEIYTSNREQHYQVKDPFLTADCLPIAALYI